jgi:hypothetical protein
LSRSVAGVKEETQLTGLVFTEMENEGLLWIAIAIDHDSMVTIQVQFINPHTFFVRPGNHLEIIYLERKPS